MPSSCSKQKNSWLQQEGKRTHFEICQNIHLPQGGASSLGPKPACLAGYQSLTGLGKHSTVDIVLHLRSGSTGVSRLRDTCEPQSRGTGSTKRLRPIRTTENLAYLPHITKSLFTQFLCTLYVMPGYQEKVARPTRRNHTF